TQIQSNIFYYEVTDSGNNLSSINNVKAKSHNSKNHLIACSAINHSGVSLSLIEVLSDISAEIRQPKMSQRLKASLLQCSTFPHAVKK
ncbi:12536_t:CDS:1, partial [Racocetra persica]